MAKVQIKFDKLSPLRAFLGEEYYNILCAANKSMNLMVETLLSTAHQRRRRRKAVMSSLRPSSCRRMEPGLRYVFLFTSSISEL